MAKYLAIAGASNYGWKEMKIWVRSLKMSGFDGDIVIVATNITKETVEKLVSEGVKVELYGKYNEHTNTYVNESNMPPHVERMLYIWNYLHKTAGEYDFVLTTDIRDVLFQSNPIDYYEANPGFLLASSEHVHYKDEPWNNQNLMQAFGPFFHEKYKHMLVHNVGVLMGNINFVKDLLFMIFQMSQGRPIPVVDQVVYNILLQQYPIGKQTNFTDNHSAWAAQLGTTEEAVKSGSGDLGAMYKNNMDEYYKIYRGPQPRLDDNGYVVNANGVPFCVVHQYDRTHAWKNKIIARYDDNEETVETWVYGH